jgi:hypothetical protein
MKRIPCTLGLLSLLLALLPAAPSAGHDEPGSLLIFPYVDASPSGATLVSVTNTFAADDDCGNQYDAGDVLLHWIYIDEESCLQYDRFEFLTQLDHLMVHARRHNPSGGRGYLVVLAKDPETEALRNFNHLVGEAFVIEEAGEIAWTYEAIAFRALEGTVEFPCDRPNPDVDQDGSADFDGIEYEMFPKELLVPSFLEQRSPDLVSRLVLLSTAGPGYSNEYELLIHNNNEVVFSAGHRFVCWMAEPLAEVAPITGYLMGDPDESIAGIESGWIRIRGKFLVDESGSVVRDPDTGDLVLPPLLGVLMQRLRLDRPTDVMRVSAAGDPLRFFGGAIDGLQLPQFESLP